MPKLASKPTLELEAQAQQRGFLQVAGVDEAGRGPLAGPLVVSAVVLGSQWDLTHPLNDSKQLAPEERERLFSIIRKEAQGHKIIVVSAQAIDESNILAATLQAMAASLDGLTPRPDYALIDGNRYPPTELPGETVVKGDARSLSIAAASILAKVVHDRLMRVYARRYPQWGFDRHLGYPTREHRQAIQAHGLSPIHRKTFRSRPRPEQLSLL